MSEAFIGEIRLFPINFAPTGWAICQGQILPINQNQALFSILGTTYGGDGITNFALPNLQGRTPIGADSMNPMGQKGGEENHTLTVNEMPTHIHTVQASSSAADQPSPQGNTWAAQTNLYGSPGQTVQMNAAAVSSAGASQPHSNMQPYLALNFCIALQGIYPSRN